MMIVPTSPVTYVPAQISVTLAEQPCVITIMADEEGRVFLSLSVNGTSLADTMLCMDRRRLINHAYLGFTGNLAFVDMQGTADPDASELGDRYKLVYLEDGE